MRHFSLSRRHDQPVTREKLPGFNPVPSPTIPPSPYKYRGHRQQVVHEETNEDERSTTALVSDGPPGTASLPPVNLKVKRVDYYYSKWSKVWKYKNTGSSFNPEVLFTVGNGNPDGPDPWQSYCFVVVRKLPQANDEPCEPTFDVVVKSPYLLTACKDVIQTVPGISWTAEPLELDPYLLLAFLPQFEEYASKLRNTVQRTVEQMNVMKTVDVLIEYLRKDYKATLAKVANLTAHHEITFDTIFAIFIPRTIVVAECPITGEPRAFRLLSATRGPTNAASMPSFYELVCESIDYFSDDMKSSSGYGTAVFNPTKVPGGYDPNGGAPSIISTAGVGVANGKPYGFVQNRILVTRFKGTVKIDSLDVYPLEHHPDADRLKVALFERGQKWLSLRGISHMQYEGLASYRTSSDSALKLKVKSRVIIDRASFRRLNPNYDMPAANRAQPPPFMAQPHGGGYVTPPMASTLQIPNNIIPTLRVPSRAPQTDEPVSTEDVMIAPSVVYGFNLTDKMWLEFNIEKVQPIVWNNEAFANLVLPADRKLSLQSLVEAHNGDPVFDDFVQNKGRGLVVNLFGPPGVGKTLSAEATSEHVRQPLYVVGAGELGTSASLLDAALNRVLDLATSWNAIVLIDEADVFLEQRSLHDLERNAMVAVFLRHVEYYPGILFLTTNRVKAFDEAFLSRIHVALHFYDLTKDARKQIWAAFLNKVGINIESFGADHLDKLAEREVNGRQIKNAVRTASSLAAKRGMQTTYAHLMETLDAVEEFTAEFAAIQASA
ncbi:P-loop containing nucleoside triphosphate hydrolase protein [Cubamyces lactineus]|nr:P-loop containing nucleoside triphosphate hydrolase protein [Cubamyces lactineus]